MERYYYKKINGNGLMNLRKPTDKEGYIQISKTEYDEILKANRERRTPTETEKAYKDELKSIQKWFELYDRQIQEYNRCARLGIEYDAKYGTLVELDAQAVFNAKRIVELKNLLNEGV